MGIRARVRELLERPGSANLQRYRPIVTRAGERERELREYSDAELTAAANRLREGTFDKAGLAQVCALGREAARRTLGERPFEVQLLGVAAMLNGRVVEMATGEGKTLVCALAAAGYVLQGRRVHVVSVNDYLARRDAEWMAEFYALLGVSVGSIDQHSTDAERRIAYRAEVTYASVNEVGFDVLRDRMRTEASELVTAEPDVVLVDEIDSVLVDEATVPLVLAGSAERAHGDPQLAGLVRKLKSGTHYEVDADERNVNLTDTGLDHVERELGGIRLHTEEHAALLTELNLALHARALLRRDVDYLVRKGKVELVNRSRGRVARLQRWPDGLQAAVEAKEGLAASPTGEVLDSMIVQSLIGRYRTVSGCSGTAMGVATELAEFYKLSLGAVPTNLPCVREDEPDRLYETAERKQAALVEYVREVHETGRPVLIGTASVAESEQLAAQLDEVGVYGVILNAKNDAQEAGIIARAGEHGRVTISTQMAGRGTDIRLGSANGRGGERIARLGGLCVVGSGRYHTGRLDDQLRGRAGRQGDPGSSVLFTSLEDPVVTHNIAEPRPPAQVGEDGQVTDRRCVELVRHAQRVSEAAHLEIHRNTWRYHQLIAKQRELVLTERDAVLRGERAAELLRERCADRYAALREEGHERSAIDRAARLVMLFHLDRRWTEHLAFLTDVREGIHLRALARETPIDEFHRIAVAEFAQFSAQVHERSASTFEEVKLTENGVDLEGIGLRRPNSTWTYMVTDNPFGSEEERALAFLGRALKSPKTDQD
ncbi:accessory Sec system translocase SecA2 [Sciscionella marina]|uniref:accessory Sec system translocase SecA2 n=1 Tax=Sciscionella marina TaxID=508770 RepID=UPI00037716A0|nr:accessory Sec system translocase SecA2 [Sciscionella marina]